MALTRFAMIIKGPGYDPSAHRAHLDSPVFATTVVCVSSFEQAVPVARELALEGIQLLELCGGFLPDQAAAIQEVVGSGVPVGVVRYTAEEREALAARFGKPAPPRS